MHLYFNNPKQDLACDTPVDDQGGAIRALEQAGLTAPPCSQHGRESARYNGKRQEYGKPLLLALMTVVEVWYDGNIKGKVKEISLVKRTGKNMDWFVQRSEVAPVISGK